jgi:uncharacterized protein
MKPELPLYSRRRLLSLPLLALAAVGLPRRGVAMTLQEASARLASAKTDGLVGERPDGYLGVVQPSSEADMVVNLINAARREEYQRIAVQQGVPRATVEALAGERAIARSASGHFILEGGRWVRKP